MKDKSWILLCIVLLLFVSCSGKNSKNTQNNEKIITTINDQDIGNNYVYKMEINDYNYLFEINNDGVYIVDELFNFNLIIDKNIYLDRRYGDLLFFRHNVFSTYIMYDYSTKTEIEIDLNYIKLVKYISENTIEIIGKSFGSNDDNVITINYSHNNDIGGIIDYEKDDENIIIYNSILDFFQDKDYDNNKSDDIYILEIFDKRICFDLTNIKPRIDNPRLEIYYDNFHNIYYLCAWAMNGMG
jgi:hypothetical protein